MGWLAHRLCICHSLLYSPLICIYHPASLPPKTHTHTHTPFLFCFSVIILFSMHPGLLLSRKSHILDLSDCCPLTRSCFNTSVENTCLGWHHIRKFQLLQQVQSLGIGGSPRWCHWKAPGSLYNQYASWGVGLWGHRNIVFPSNLTPKNFAIHWCSLRRSIGTH